MRICVKGLSILILLERRGEMIFAHSALDFRSRGMRGGKGETRRKKDRHRAPTIFAGRGGHSRQASLTRKGGGGGGKKRNQLFTRYILILLNLGGRKERRKKEEPSSFPKKRGLDLRLGTGGGGKEERAPSCPGQAVLSPSKKREGGKTWGARCRSSVFP